MFKDFLVLSALAKGGGASIEDADWDIFKKTGLVPLITDRVASFSAINAMIDPLGIEYKAGEKYLVKWEGVDYETTCFSMPVEMGGAHGTMYYLGNPALTLDTEHMGDTGEPFIFYALTAQGQEFQTGVTKSDNKQKDIHFSISAYEEVKSTIPQKYLPEGYPYKGVVEILPEMELLPENSDEGAYYLPQMNLQAGGKYTVCFDGTNYECVSTSIVDDDIGACAVLGNVAALGLEGFEDTGEPFMVADFGVDISGGANIYGMALILTGATSATLSITGNILEKMSPEYMPELDYVIIKSSTVDSTKKFKITVDDSGTITATEIK